MLYPKNVPLLERVLRVIFGVILVGLVVFGSSFWGALSPFLIGLSLFTAAFTIVTGYVGWCPACALVGRKIKQKALKSDH